MSMCSVILYSDTGFLLYQKTFLSVSELRVFILIFFILIIYSRYQCIIAFVHVNVRMRTQCQCCTYIYVRSPIHFHISVRI